MGLLAVIVIGHDRPGIIADATEALAATGGNLEDSSMTLLRGHFVMSLVVRTQAAKSDVEAALRPRFDAHELDVVVMELDDSSAAGGQGESFVLSVHGADQVGIVAAMTRVLADHGANITDLTTRLAGGLYLLVAEAQVPASVDGEALAAAVEAKATELGVEARWRAADTDLL